MKKSTIKKENIFGTCSTHLASKSKGIHLGILPPILGCPLLNCCRRLARSQTQVWDHKTWHKHHPNPHWIPPYHESFTVKAPENQRGGLVQTKFPFGIDMDRPFSGFIYCIMLVSRRLLSLSYRIFSEKATWPLRIDWKCPKYSSPKVKKLAVKSIPNKIAPAYDTKTWAGNILSFAGSAVICGVPFRIKESRKV